MEERSQIIEQLRIEKFKMIKRLHDFNMSIDEIAVIVNLPVDKIKKILEAGEHGIELIQESDLLS